MIPFKPILAALLLSIAISPVRAEDGIASFYESGPTASGEITRPSELTAAHRTLPFGTRVQVTNAHNGRSVVVRIVDRGPFKRDRIIDVSLAAARELDMIEDGTTKVSVVRTGDAAQAVVRAGEASQGEDQWLEKLQWLGTLQ